LALAVAIFAGTFVYEDGATLLAATLAASGRLNPVLALVAAFVGIWMGDIGLYAMGSNFRKYTVRWRRLQRFLKPESFEKAQAWFAKHGAWALVMSRTIPGSRLPLYLAAGALQLPLRRFAQITGMCGALWVSAIFSIWRFIPKISSGHQKLIPSLLTAMLLSAPWLLTKSVRSLGRLRSKRESVRHREVVGLCAL